MLLKPHGFPRAGQLNGNEGLSVMNVFSNL